MSLATALLLELTGAVVGGMLVLAMDNDIVARRRRNHAARRRARTTIPTRQTHLNDTNSSRP